MGLFTKFFFFVGQVFVFYIEELFMPGKLNHSKTYNVFLSYRRDGGEAMAILLRDRLTEKGYRVFLDVENLNAGIFNDKLFEVIDECTDFVIICSAGCLDRCVNEDDWVHKEISHAYKTGKNIVPFILRGFEWPEVLPEDIELLRMQNGVTANNNEFFEAVINRLADKFLESTPQKTKKLLSKVMKAASAVLGILTLVTVLTVGVITLLGFGENITQVFYVNEDRPASNEPSLPQNEQQNTPPEPDYIPADTDNTDTPPDITTEPPVTATTTPMTAATTTPATTTTTTTTHPATTTAPTTTHNHTSGCHDHHNHTSGCHNHTPGYNYNRTSRYHCRTVRYAYYFCISGNGRFGFRRRNGRCRLIGYSQSDSRSKSQFRRMVYQRYTGKHKCCSYLYGNGKSNAGSAVYYKRTYRYIRLR
jgi:hypothetical protein